METKVFCRSSYCSRCYEKRSPHRKDYYVVFGSDSQEFKPFACEYDMPFKRVGFTPHIFTLEEVVKNKYVLAYNCEIHGCGVLIISHENDNGYFTYTYKFIHTKTVTLKKKDYKALLSHPDLGYRI